MLPKSELERGNRRGCLIIAAALALLLLLLGIIALRGGDLQQANEAVSTAPVG